MLKDQRFSKSPFGNTKFYSQLSLNGHLCKTDTLLKRHLELVPAFLFSFKLPLCERDISLRQTLSAGPRGVLLRGVDCTVNTLLTDTFMRWTPPYNGHLELVPTFLYSLSLTFYQMDVPPRQTLSAGSRGVYLGDSWL